MSVLGELDLLGPRVRGATCGGAVPKAVAEDFQVDETLDTPLSGKGEYFWLWVKKHGLSTEEAARRLGRAAGVQQKDISCAGLKSRQVLTRRWLSLHLSGKTDPDLGATKDANLWVLHHARHSCKLQRGAHTTNDFTLRLTGLRAECAVLDARLERITVDGVPNCFDLQCFGHGGGNLVDARSCAEQDLLPANCNLRSCFLSAERNYLFNRLLAERVAEGSWGRATVGDLLAFTDSRSFFPVGEEECRDTRLVALDLHPTEPLWGEGDPPGGAGVLDRELTLAGSESALHHWLAKAGTAYERHILRFLIQELAWHYPEPDVLQLEFVLPTGYFATIVMREILDLIPIGQMESPHAY